MSQKQLGKCHVRKFVDESDAVEFLQRPRFLPADHCANCHNAHFKMYRHFRYKHGMGILNVFQSKLGAVEFLQRPR